MNRSTQSRSSCGGGQARNPQRPSPVPAGPPCSGAAGLPNHRHRNSKALEDHIQKHVSDCFVTEQHLQNFSGLGGHVPWGFSAPEGRTGTAPGPRTPGPAAARRRWRRSSRRGRRPATGSARPGLMSICAVYRCRHTRVQCAALHRRTGHHC